MLLDMDGQGGAAGSMYVPIYLPICWTTHIPIYVPTYSPTYLDVNRTAHIFPYYLLKAPSTPIVQYKEGSGGSAKKEGMNARNVGQHPSFWEFVRLSADLQVTVYR